MKNSFFFIMYSVQRESDRTNGNSVSSAEYGWEILPYHGLFMDNHCDTGEKGEGHAAWCGY